jgi:hypothetical protein
MKCKFGAIVVDGRNKIGGHVASKNRAGSYFRTKVTPTNPGTTYQVNARNRLAGLSSAWRALTANERTAWNAVVADFARTDIFGDLKHPSGFNLHQKLNNNLLNSGESVITAPPLPQAVNAFSSFSIAADFNAQTFTLTFAPVVDDNHKVLIWATPSLSQGISFVKSEYRNICAISQFHYSPLSMETLYIARFGAIGAENTKIFAKLVQVNMTTGQAGIPIQASCIVAAV